jgi:hypothetical protein
MKYLRLSELAGEGDMFLIGDVLTGKHHDQVFHPGIDNLLQRFGIQGLPHIDAVDFRAQGGMSCFDCNRHAGYPANVSARLEERVNRSLAVAQ